METDSNDLVKVLTLIGCFSVIDSFDANGACAHYVMVSKFQWKPFWLVTQRDPLNDWTATQNGVNYDVFAQAPLVVSALNCVLMEHSGTFHMVKGQKVAGKCLSLIGCFGAEITVSSN